MKKRDQFAKQTKIMYEELKGLSPLWRRMILISDAECL